MEHSRQLFRPSSAVVHLGHLAANYALLRRDLKPQTAILAMVKADAYGHGAVAVAKKLSQLGVAGFGVATLEEGIELRSAGLLEPVVVMGGMLGVGGPACEMLLHHRLTPVVHSEQAIELLEQAAAKLGQKVSVHLKIDTGMSRLGVLPKDLPAVLHRLKSSPSVELAAVMTHLACGDEPDFTAQQLNIFARVHEKILQLFGNIPLWHVANSAALLMNHAVNPFPAEQTWVRPGLALYGLAAGVSSQLQLQPVMSLLSHVALIKTIPAGSHVSYGATFTAKRATKLAVVPIGYADGYPFRVSGKASVLVRGKRLPVLGRVTMDMIMCDLTDLPEAAVGDEVVLLGRQGGSEIRAEDLAAWAETIPYEILCGISKRMPRVYVES